MTEYRVGEHVSVKAVVHRTFTSNSGQAMLTLKRQHADGSWVNFDIAADQVDRKIIPPEPDRTSILKSPDGLLFVYREGRGEGWAQPTWSSGTNWEEIYTRYGPFAVFAPKESI